jgi:hypothetical protein
MHMHKVFWAVIGTSLFFFVVILLQVGIGPRPIQVIKPSLLEQPEEAGMWIYRQLRHQVFKYPITVFGLDQDASHSQVTLGFLNAALKDHQNFAAVVLPEKFNFESPIPKLGFTHPSQINSLIDTYKTGSQKVLLLLPSAESSHLVTDSFLQKYTQEPHKEAFAVTLLSWRKDDPSHQMVEPKCEAAEKLTHFEDVRMFFCFYFSKMKKLDEKSEASDRKRYGIILDQFGQSNYVMMTDDRRDQNGK